MTDNLTKLKAPFVWFGGKSKIADEIWSRFGKTHRYIEPFLGSGAVWLRNPHWESTFEVINDLDHFVANAWRSLKFDSDLVAEFADEPTHEISTPLRTANIGEKRLRKF